MTNDTPPSFFERLTGAAKMQDIPSQDFPVQKDYKEQSSPIEVHSTPATNSRKTPLVTKDEEEGQLTIDVYQTDTEIVIKSPVAGVKSEDLDVTITNDMVTIKGRRENEEPVAKEHYFFQELYWGPFSRSVILPTEIEIDQAKAILKDGILTIRLPKIEKETAKKLSIQMG